MKTDAQIDHVTMKCYEGAVFQLLWQHRGGSLKTSLEVIAGKSQRMSSQMLVNVTEKVILHKENSIDKDMKT